ncbi:MAG: chorismate synthase [Muribaculaceae bacterium]|nr:chorismate synthase [Muribaculaceae bacterium]
MNTLGHYLRFTSFGESHGPAVGGIIDGMPAGLPIDLGAIQAMLHRRRPGSGNGNSTRREDDTIEILSGIYEGHTTGTPIAFMIANRDARSEDYDLMRNAIRPGHADATYLLKYGIRDHRGGGRASARATAATVAAGAMAMQFIATAGITVNAAVESIGGMRGEQEIGEALARARAEGDTLGGVVRCTIHGVPAGLGEPIFGKLQAWLALAMMSLNAVKGFEYGEGFAAAGKKGSESLDHPVALDSALHTEQNHAGGLLGGISTGEDITMRIAFKPIATMMRPIPTLRTDGTPCTLEPRGRHDVCAAPRAVPVVEALAALVIADALLASRLSRV